MKETAAQAVSEFIRSPDLFQFDLFESPTITQLKGDTKYGHLYQLLEIILNGNLKVSPCTEVGLSTGSCGSDEFCRHDPDVDVIQPCVCSKICCHQIQCMLSSCSHTSRHQERPSSAMLVRNLQPSQHFS